MSLMLLIGIFVVGAIITAAVVTNIGRDNQEDDK